MIDVKTRMALLNRMHLFNQMGDEELAGISHVLDEKNYGPEAVVFQRGDEPDGFYMVYSGRVKVTRPRNRGQDFLAWLVKGDYFGEEAMFQNRKRSATVTTVENTTLLFLSRNDFESLLKKYPQLKPNFQVAIKSRQLARQMRFKWLGPREVIYFIARRHYIKLIQALVGPVLFVVLPIFLFFWSFLTNAVTPGVVGVIVLVGTLLWGTWNVIDWSNDYYIVTNQRVIWLEKVIGIYDSRQEAPLSTVLSVGISTDMLGRTFDFGTVTVRTFVGKIVFDFVTYPDEAAAIVREHWERSKEGGVRAQKEAMKNAIRAKLGLTVHTKAENEDVPVKVELPNPQKMSALRVVLSNLFKLRVESSGTITYHKHWYVLLLQTWKPIAAILFLFIAGLWRTWDLWQKPGETVFSFVDGTFSVDTMLLAIPIIMLPMAGWLVWEYADWKNDIFQVTPDEIFDIDKKPLGNEERRAAQLENILSTEYKRIGLAGYALNFGTVYISVGGTTMAFEDVMDPAGVQADIDRRRMARMDAKREESAKQDRERMATWIAAYHNNLDEFNAPPPSPTSLGDNEPKSG
ncbi:MAG: cyclic nucleotide-binding domain-containing protein [Chloroflexota bacterium]